MPRKSREKRIGEYIRDYGAVPLLPASLLGFITHVLEINGTIAEAEIDFRMPFNGTDNKPGVSEQELIVKAHLLTQEECPCPCHKLCVMTFYELGPNGEYLNVPLVDGVPDTKYLRIGKVMSLVVRHPGGTD